LTDDGDERWPIAYVTLTGHPSMREMLPSTAIVSTSSSNATSVRSHPRSR
jgi:hypothetical protein